MEKVCLKCGYKRKQSDTSPDYLCPSCDVVYAKYEAKLARENLIPKENKATLQSKMNEAPIKSSRNKLNKSSKYKKPPSELVNNIVVYCIISSVIFLPLAYFFGVKIATVAILIFVILFCIGSYIEAKDKRNIEIFQKEKLAAERKREVLYKEVTLIIDKHRASLKAECFKSISHDAYGNYFYNQWHQEIDYFIDNVLKKHQGINKGLKHELDIDGEISKVSNKFFNNEIDFEKMSNWIINLKDLKKIERDVVHDMIYDAITPYYFGEIDEEISYNINDIEQMSANEFEHFCAEILLINGWEARVTQASGDQGIDVIAQKANVKAVFQCKKYSTPVGNKAVQEIIAGKHFEQAHVAAVVSNALFTKSAKQLADVANVYLLHYSELTDFSEKLKI